MKAIDNPEQFTRLQHQVLLLLARSVRDTLSRQGIIGEELRELVADLTASVAFAFDGCEVFDASVLPFRPKICFSGMELEKGTLLFGGGAIVMHQAAHFAAEEACDE